MEPRPGDRRIRPEWWALILVVLTVVFVVVTSAIFAGSFRSSVPVTLKSERSGLIMETNAKVKMRGVEVGRVGHVGASDGSAELQLELDPAQIQHIPANVEAQINATTAFGAKFVDLVYPENPSSEHLTAGAVVRSSNVSTEVNTVFENVVDLVDMIDPAKLNAVLSAVADAVRGQGERMGQATTDLNEVLTALNDRSDLIREDWRSFKNFTDTYAAAAQDILVVLDAAPSRIIPVRWTTCCSTSSVSVTPESMCSPRAKTTSWLLLTCSNPPRICCWSTAPPTPASCRARISTSRTEVTTCSGEPTAAHSISMSRCCSATTPTATRITCPSSQHRADPAGLQVAAPCPTWRRTFRCAN